MGRREQQGGAERWGNVLPIVKHMEPDFPREHTFSPAFALGGLDWLGDDCLGRI
jgi:hypothetical protein